MLTIGRKKWIVFALLLVLLVAATAGAVWLFAPSAKSALIVDQLSLGMPNPDFREKAARLLEEAGYQVTYVPNQELTVEFFRNLPARGDDLILLRVHSSGRIVTNQGDVLDDTSISLCTGEPLSKAYPKERNSGQLGGFETIGSDTLFFSVRGEFFKRSAVGRFKKSIIVIMGCEGLRIPKTANIFLDLGAQAVLGWTDQLSSQFMDQATLTFLDTWLKQQQKLADAVKTTQKKMGKDPYFPNTEFKMLF